MTTLNEMIEVIKAENPTIRIGDDEAGYTDFTSAEYDAQVAIWAQGRLDKQARIAEAEAKATAKAAAQAKLAALGLTVEDLQALGL
jgi:hypothetical protein